MRAAIISGLMVAAELAFASAAHGQAAEPGWVAASLLVERSGRALMCFDFEAENQQQSIELAHAAAAASFLELEARRDGTTARVVYSPCAYARPEVPVAVCVYVAAPVDAYYWAPVQRDARERCLAEGGLWTTRDGIDAGPRAGPDR